MWPLISPASGAPTSRIFALTSEWPVFHISGTPPVHPDRARDPARWGEAPFYGWSEDKARQYGVPQREDFGAFVQKRGINLD